MNMPATLTEIAGEIQRVLADGRSRTEDELVAALQEQGLLLGVNPVETVAEVLESDEVGLVMPLGDGRHALLPALLIGRTFTHRGPPFERIRATITLDDSIVRVETNSEPRMDRVLEALRAQQPGVQLLNQTRHAPDDLQEAMSRAPAGAPAQALDPTDPQIAAALEQMVRAHERAWLDEPIPALAGITPRDAAADPTRRPDLIRLLDSFGPGGPGAMDAGRLRAHLGL